MALRAGGGGLKYPLPSQYQIGAQQSAAAASAGGSASSSAYGANRQFAANKMRVQADLANSAADRQFRAMSQMQGQQFEAQQNYYDREHRKGAQLEAQRFDAAQQDQRLQQQKEMQWEGHYLDAEQARQNRDFLTNRDQAGYEQDQASFERKVDADIQAQVRAGKLELTPGAQKELDQIAAGRVEAQKLDPIQRDEFEKQAAQRERELLRTAQAPKGPTATGRANLGITYYDPERKSFTDQPGPNGVAGTIGKDGQFQPIAAGGDSKEQVKKNDALVKRARKMLDDSQEEGGTKLTLEGALEAAQKEQMQVDTFFAPKSQQQGQSQQRPAMGMGDSLAARSGDDIPPPITDVKAAKSDLGQLPTPMSAAERNAIPAGALYLTPNGEMRRKK